MKVFVVEPMQSRKSTNISGRTLTELLVCCTLIILLLTGFYNYFSNTNHETQKNLLKLKKLQQALYLARSEAINQHAKVGVCPSYNLKTCTENWTNDLIIFTEDRILHHIQLKFTDPLFKFFGNQKNQIIFFLPNGLTHNNGRFCINNQENCLYINKAGKVYIT